MKRTAVEHGRELMCLELAVELLTLVGCGCVVRFIPLAPNPTHWQTRYLPTSVR